MAIWSRPEAAVHVPNVRVPSAAWKSAQAGLARAGRQLALAGHAALSPAAWWARITSVTGVAVLLGFSIVTLIAGLIVTWPRP